MSNLRAEDYSCLELNDWTDLYFQTRVGYINVTNLNDGYGSWYSSNDMDRLVSDTRGKPKQYMSINSFKYDSQERAPRRTKENLRQIRNIAIDIDQYTKDMTIEDAIDVINSLVLEGIIPEPNFVYVSRGIQLFYNINGGASPGIEWLTHYITCIFIEKLQSIGADLKASDSTRLMRVPFSINEKNGAIVKPELWNNQRYSLEVLRTFTDLDKYKPPSSKNKKDTSNKVLSLKTIRFRNTLFYRANYARIRDLEKLFELRNGIFTNLRNEFIYIYSYHYSLIFGEENAVLKKVTEISKNIKSSEKDEFTSKEIKNTVKSAFKDAKKFMAQYKKDDYKVVYRAGDGVIKPMKTVTVIDKLSISEKEMEELSNLYDPKFKPEKERERVRKYYGLNGSMKEYNQSRKDKSFEEMKKVKEMMEQGLKQEQMAKNLGVSTRTIRRLIKKSKEMEING